jgi:hypothetical protein
METYKKIWLDGDFYYRISKTNIGHGLYNIDNKNIGYGYQGKGKGFTLSCYKC